MTMNNDFGRDPLDYDEDYHHDEEEENEPENLERETPECSCNSCEGH